MKRRGPKGTADSLADAKQAEGQRSNEHREKSTHNDPPNSASPNRYHR